MCFAAWTGRNYEWRAEQIRKPPPIDHERIDIACSEKSSQTLYWYDNEWHTLQGAD